MPGASRVEFGKDLGLLHEVVVTGRKVGADSQFWSALAHDERKFREVVAMVIGQPGANFRRDKRQEEGWELVSTKPRTVTESSKLEFVPVIKLGEDYVGGNEIKSRAAELGIDLGQEDAEFLLDHPELLPKRSKDAECVVFPGTLWRAPGGRLIVPSLIFWFTGRWHMLWIPVDDAWYSGGKFLHSRN